MGGKILGKEFSTHSLYHIKEETIMAALVETMYSTREKPWHGLGTVVREAPTSENALRLAGLDWNVVQEPIYTPFREKIDGFKTICNNSRKLAKARH